MPASHVNLSTVQTTSPTELETAVPTWAYMDQPRARASIQAFWDACMTHSDDFDLIYVKHPRICRRGPFVFLTDMGTKTTQEQDAEEYGLSIEPDRVISVVEDSKRLSVLEAPNHDSAWPHDERLFFTENGAEGTEAVYLLERKAGSATAEVKQSTSASCSSKYALEFNEVSSPSV